MFEYTKEILMKVSFDRVLFRKELKKAVKWLKREERGLLMVWCITTFGHRYADIIAETFKHVSK
ncbi:MAG: hypothetical protein BWY67_00775 [Bacteroidetes bacterium ADurb.Bin397]|jgi:hypothetical protein|nr:hypothetical protein [Bacteroidota bacterium]MBK9046947.1 hypothetical protein [Bacteroidota bacterium]MBK9422629.1 hypothetical protein [Bacteroidota bacterium]OQA11689.1 MAG: hypothetical protein BWY67_00775 [Bacteroidetes bacterium ADurb.Bin397]